LTLSRCQAALCSGSTSRSRTRNKTKNGQSWKPKEYDWETSYRRRIEEQNAENRRFAAMTGSLAPIMNRSW
jgi:hypothetical protein